MFGRLSDSGTDEPLVLLEEVAIFCPDALIDCVSEVGGVLWEDGVVALAALVFRESSLAVGHDTGVSH